MSWVGADGVTLSYPSNVAGHDGAPLVERDGDGDTDRAQGRDGRREGHRGDAARSPAATRSCAPTRGATIRDEQLSGTTYEPFIGPGDLPPIEKNREIMAEFLERLRPLHYDASRYETYLEQLGIEYPQLEKPVP